MKTNYKVSLNNLVGAVAKIVPELGDKLQGLQDVAGDSIIIEGSAEYSISELGAVMNLIPHAVDVLAETYRKVCAYDKEFSAPSDEVLQLRSALNSNNEYIKMTKRLAHTIDEKNAELAHAYAMIGEKDAEIRALKMDKYSANVKRNIRID